MIIALLLQMKYFNFHRISVIAAERSRASFRSGYLEWAIRVRMANKICTKLLVYSHGIVQTILVGHRPNH